MEKWSKEEKKKEFRVKLQEHAASLMSVLNPIVVVQRGGKESTLGPNRHHEVMVMQRHLK